MRVPVICSSGLSIVFKQEQIGILVQGSHKIICCNSGGVLSFQEKKPFLKKGAPRYKSIGVPGSYDGTLSKIKARFSEDSGVLSLATGADNRIVLQPVPE
jgi:hypothetical protein